MQGLLNDKQWSFIRMSKFLTINVITELFSLGTADVFDKQRTATASSIDALLTCRRTVTPARRCARYRCADGRRCRDQADDAACDAPARRGAGDTA